MFPSLLYAGLPAVSFVIDAPHPACRYAAPTSIEDIIGLRAIPKIDDPVISRIAIYVIDNARRPDSVSVEPRKAVRYIHPLSYADEYRRLGMPGTRNGPFCNGAVPGCPMEKQSAGGVIMIKLAKPFGAELSFFIASEVGHAATI
jgi:hypothetical protein